MRVNVMSEIAENRAKCMDQWDYWTLYWSLYPVSALLSGVDSSLSSTKMSKKTAFFLLLSLLNDSPARVSSGKSHLNWNYLTQVIYLLLITRFDFWLKNYQPQNRERVVVLCRWSHAQSRCGSMFVKCVESNNGRHSHTRTHANTDSGHIHHSFASRSRWCGALQLPSVHESNMWSWKYCNIDSCAMV